VGVDVDGVIDVLDVDSPIVFHGTLPFLMLEATSSQEVLGTHPAFAGGRVDYQSYSMAPFLF